MTRGALAFSLLLAGAVLAAPVAAQTAMAENYVGLPLR